MENVTKRPGAWQRIRRPALLLLFLVLCIGSVALVLFVDQAEVLASTYINAAKDGNSGLASLLGDRFSENSAFNQKMLSLDFKRDSEYLKGGEITGLSLERTQSLSGQWLTLASFQYRQPGTSGWRPVTLRIKTGSWLFITYIRAVEQVDP